MASKASVGNPGIQKSWLNLIMHLTAIIAERKQDIGSAHLLRTIADVFVIIFLEGVLAIVSIPIYFETNKGHYSKENDFYIQYRVRKYITFLLISLISAVFVLKLCLTFWMTFSTVENSSGSIIPAETSSAAVEIINAERDGSVAVPTIESTQGTEFKAAGTALNNSKVFVFVSPANGKNAREMTIFRTDANSSGKWSVSGAALVRPGQYSISAAAIDTQSKFRSAESKSISVEVQPTVAELINQILDRMMGFLVMSFIAIGLIVLILTI